MDESTMWEARASFAFYQFEVRHHNISKQEALQKIEERFSEYSILLDQNDRKALRKIQLKVIGRIKTRPL